MSGRGWAMRDIAKRAVRSLLGRAGYRIEGTRYTPRHFLDPARLRRVEFDDVVCRLMYERGDELTFLQLGAYDGVTKDPLRKFIVSRGWKGVLVEPQPGPAAKLRALYPAGSGVKVVEAAVDRERGERSMFTVEGEDVPAWAGGMSSFSRAHLLEHDYALPGIERYIRENRVACVTFDDVLDQLPAPPDLLQVDVEGADAYLLSLFPFHRVKPAVVHFETKVLSRAEKEAAFDLLAANGYRLAPSGDEDTLATLD